MKVTGVHNRLQATEFEVKKDTTSIISKEYEFYADGQMKLSTDNNNAKFDRLFKYDHQARVTNVMSGAEARGSTDTAANIPFGNTFGFNAFDNQTAATNKHFTNAGGGNSYTYSYANNRISGLSNGNYDADGRQIRSVDNVYKTYSYNAAGQMSSSYYEHRVNSALVYENFETITYSGDGQVVKIATLHDPVEGDNEADTNYQIRSTVLGGQTITKVQSGGQKLESSIVAAGTVVATHGFDWINWRHNDPNSDSIRSTNASGQTLGAGEDDFNDHELDGQGRSIGFANPYSNDPQWDNIPDLFNAQQSMSSMVNGMPQTFKLDGLQVPKSLFDERTEFLGENIFLMIRHMRYLSNWKRKIGETWLTVTYNPRQANLPAGVDVNMSESVTFKTADVYEYLSVSNWSVLSLLQVTKVQSRDKEYVEKDALRTELKKRYSLNGGECRRKLDALLKALDKSFSHKPSGTSGFEALAESFLTGKGKLLQVESGNSNFNSGTGKITMNVSLERGKNSVEPIVIQGTEFIHELLHGASGDAFSHETIIKKIAKLEGLDFALIKKGQRDEDRLSGTKSNDNSLYEQPMNAWINKYCGGGSKIWDDFAQKYAR